MKKLIQDYLMSKKGSNFDNYNFCNLQKDDTVEVDNLEINGHICNVEYSFTEDGNKYPYNKVMVELWDVVDFIYNSKQ